MNQIIFDKNLIYLSKELPSSIISLEDWSVITVFGKDCTNYLNSQFTIDMLNFKRNIYKFGAHCNFNGKVWTPFIIFKYKSGYAYIIRSSLVEIHLKEIKKYSIFSEISIKIKKNFCLLGLSGINATKNINFSFQKEINKKTKIIFLKKEIIILKLNYPVDRFFLIFPNQDIAQCWLNSIKFDFIKNNSNQWVSLDIECFFPVFDKICAGKFLPQFLNLKYWDAINLNKGCYYGQEIIFRCERNSINLFNLFILIGFSDHYPIIGSKVFQNDAKGNFFIVGTILSCVCIKKDQFLLQVCIKKRNYKNKIFFLKNNTNSNFYLLK